MSLITKDEINALCLWDKLIGEKRPILLYGTGNGADKILAVCEKKGIKISGVFASGGFVRDRYFHGFKVKSIEECEECFGDFVVLLAFGTTLSDVWENILSVASRHPLYIPEVPLFGDGLWDADYVRENYTEIEKTYNLFADERSKELFASLVKFRLCGEKEYLGDTEHPTTTYKLLEDKNISTVIDCGAYRGDSADDIITALGPDKIVAVEPDRKTFAKLSLYAEEEKRAHVVPLRALVAKEDGEAEIMATASRSSGKDSITRGAKCETVKTVCVDSIAKEHGKIDLIKYDVEGDEWEALYGSLETVKKDSPCLAVSVYHRTSDLFAIPRYIQTIMPNASLYLRRATCIPDWDVLLIVKT